MATFLSVVGIICASVAGWIAVVFTISAGVALGIKVARDL